MKVVAVCGPHGALLKEYVRLVKEKVGEVTVIDESNYIDEKFKINEEEFLAAIKEAKKDGPVIVYGHYLYSNETIRNACDVRLWMETDKDTCLINYMRKLGTLSECKQFEQLTYFQETLIKQNNNVILPSKKYYHMGIQNVNEHSVAIIVNSLKPAIPRNSFFDNQLPPEERGKEIASQFKF